LLANILIIKLIFLCRIGFFLFINMPQLVPFFYTHQIILVFLALGFLLLLCSKYILPNMLSVLLGRYTLGDKTNS